MEKAASEHINEMVRLGYNIILISPENKVIGKIPDGVKILAVPWPKWDNFKILMTMGAAYYIWCKRVAEILNNVTVTDDIIHFHGASAGTIMFLTDFTRKKVHTVVNPHGMEEFGSGSFFRIINRFFTKKLIRKSILADAVIATDESIVDIVKQNLNVADSKIILIPNTINVLKLRAYASQCLSKNIGIVKECITLVSIGRIEYNKGYDLLAIAIGMYQREFPNSKLRWIHYGRGKKRNEILDISQKYNINLNIIQNASDVEVQSNLAICDIFVQPSRYEGSSLTTLEAMAHGCLIVATPVGGIPDKIKNTKTGFLCNAVNAESIKNTLHKAIMFEWRDEIKKNAFTTAEKNYDISVSTKKYHLLYESMQKK